MGGKTVGSEPPSVHEIADYYSRRDVSEKIFSICEGREVVPVYSASKYGQRPSIVQYRDEIGILASRGMTSLHASVERWDNPMAITSDMTRNEMDEHRTGWDLLIDVDVNLPPGEYSPEDSLELAKRTVILLSQTLESHGLRSFSIKFSGNRGFHIGIPWECFPERVSGSWREDTPPEKPIESRLLYPDIPRSVVAFLRHRIRDVLRREIMYITRKRVEDPFSLVDVEENWGPRHLFRMPYSLNEKTWLVSLPVERDELLSFDRERARLDQVRASTGFLDDPRHGEAEDLLIEVEDWLGEQEDRKEKLEQKEARLQEEKMPAKPSLVGKKLAGVPGLRVPPELFPPCIKNILSGLEDGRKRSVFILLNFLSSCGYSWKEAGEMVREWNKKKNPEPLKDSYVEGQISYAMRRKKIVPPPNCDTPGYYRDILVCKPDNFCTSRKIKNPVSYALRKMGLQQKKKNMCPVCGRVFDTRRGLSIHMRKHAREKRAEREQEQKTQKGGNS